MGSQPRWSYQEELRTRGGPSQEEEIMLLLRGNGPEGALEGSETEQGAE